MQAIMTRRKWMMAATGGAVVAGLSAKAPCCGQQSAALSGQAGGLPYIDAHSHVWSPEIEKWPLAGKQTREDLKPLSFTPEELLALATPEGVGRVVLIQHSVYHLFDNRYLIDCARRMPGRFSVVGMIDDRDPRAGQTLRELLPAGVRGLRITPRIRGTAWLEGPGMEALWKTGAETGQAMCCLIDPTHLPQVAAMHWQLPWH